MEKDKDQLPLPISHELLKNIAQMKEVVLLSTKMRLHGQSKPSLKLNKTSKHLTYHQMLQNLTL